MNPDRSFGLLECNRTNAILLGTAIVGVILCIVGGILIGGQTSYDGYEIVTDYTDCKNPTNGKKCKDDLKNGRAKCSCYFLIEVNVTMQAPVTIFYELDSYDQITSRYSQSRDDNQLAGHLSSTPSSSCGSYTYNNTEGILKPIAPCGELADAIFNDTFTLQTNNKYLPKEYVGLISEDEKANFKNPPGDLKEAFKNFSKPKNWMKNVWELDTTIPENNGFQNEVFIIWMNTELKRKPSWRVSNSREPAYKAGIPPANYTLLATYAYPLSRYDGPRKVIISSIHVTAHPTKLGFGIFLLIVGLLGILAVPILYRKRSTIKWLNN